MKLPQLRQSILASLEGTQQAFFQLILNAEDGKLANWEIFGEFARTIVDVMKREGSEDSTKAMKGMRYSDQLMNFATVARSYGAGSASNYSLIAKYLPMPSFRHIQLVSRSAHIDLLFANHLAIPRRKVKGKMKFEVFQYPYLCEENFAVFAQQVLSSGYVGPVTVSTDCSKVDLLKTFLRGFN